MYIHVTGSLSSASAQRLHAIAQAGTLVAVCDNSTGRPESMYEPILHNSAVDMCKAIATGVAGAAMAVPHFRSTFFLIRGQRAGTVLSVAV